MADYKWTDISFIPDAALAVEIGSAWQWLIPGKWTPFFCSMIGGIFLEDHSGDIYWLESSTAEVERLAPDRATFDRIMQTDNDLVWEIFLVPFVLELREAGKIPGPGDCYSFITLPVFAEGKYEAGNICVVPARDALVLAASIHEQLSQLPDGAQVQVKFED
jgi:hypothetical protein